MASPMSDSGCGRGFARRVFQGAWRCSEGVEAQKTWLESLLSPLSCCRLLLLFSIWAFRAAKGSAKFSFLASRTPITHRSNSYWARWMKNSSLYRQILSALVMWEHCVRDRVGLVSYVFKDGKRPLSLPLLYREFRGSDYHRKVKYIFQIYIWSAVKNIFVRENLIFIEKICMLKYIFGFFYDSLNAPLVCILQTWNLGITVFCPSLL